MINILKETKQDNRIEYDWDGGRGDDIGAVT